MSKGKIAFWIFAAVVLILAGVTIWAEETGRIRYECVNTEVVETIDRVNYRTAYVTLRNGETASFSQPWNLVPGKEVCLKTERVYDF